MGKTAEAGSVTIPEEDTRKLGLMRFVLGAPCILEIDQSVADALVRAMKIIVEMVSVEQKFAILIENFLEFEQELVTRVLRNAYLHQQTAQEFFDDKQTFNRRLINILTATKLYTDQTKHHVKVIFPDEPQRWDELKVEFSKQYDEQLSFRTMEVLRNYAQHRGLPIQGLTMGSRWLDTQKEQARLEHNVAINIIVDELENDPDFKKSVLKELKALGGIKGVLDIKPFVREYVQSLASVHEAFRSMTDERVDNAVALVTEWKRKYQSECPDDDPHFLAVGWQNANNTRERIIYLSQDAIDQLGTLRSRTRSTGNLAKRFATTAPLER